MADHPDPVLAGTAHTVLAAMLEATDMRTVRTLLDDQSPGLVAEVAVDATGQLAHLLAHLGGGRVIRATADSLRRCGTEMVATGRCSCEAGGG